MRERPILFSGEMVQAILAGRKTQTRRLVKGVATCATSGVAYWPGLKHGGDFLKSQHCPYGVPGDRLWVRETFAILTGAGHRPVYRATEPEPEQLYYPGEKVSPMRWTPSIFMKRCYSRITLEVTGVRVERLQDISAADARAEGVSIPVAPCAEHCRTGKGAHEPDPAKCHVLRRCEESPLGIPLGAPFTEDDAWRETYAFLWNDINRKRAPWASNPWVWVVSFRRFDAKEAAA